MSFQNELSAKQDSRSFRQLSRLEEVWNSATFQMSPRILGSFELPSYRPWTNSVIAFCWPLLVVKARGNSLTAQMSPSSGLYPALPIPLAGEDAGVVPALAGVLNPLPPRPCVHLGHRVELRAEGVDDVGLLGPREHPGTLRVLNRRNRDVVLGAG